MQQYDVRVENTGQRRRTTVQHHGTVQPDAGDETEVLLKLLERKNENLVSVVPDGNNAYRRWAPSPLCPDVIVHRRV